MLSGNLTKYDCDNKEFEGFIAYPKEEGDKIIILAHAWAGRDDFICEAAKKIASWGYIGFAWDLYGEGIVGKSPEENTRLKNVLLNDRELLKKRLVESYAQAQRLKPTAKIGVMGFGFGGLCALDLMRCGVRLNAVVSVYGHFSPPGWKTSLLHPPKTLILHGMNDKIEPIEKLREFSIEMNKLEVEWTAHLYGGTMHAFMNPQVNLPEQGLCYNGTSADAVWRDAKIFFDQNM
ncbi:MAG: dienelactone hydrolase family protein [Parachlamydiales bacterium]|jgi:dienelactone hydrolase